MLIEDELINKLDSVTLAAILEVCTLNKRNL
jgi:hypothetical protein